MLHFLLYNNWFYIVYITKYYSDYIAKYFPDLKILLMFSLYWYSTMNLFDF